MGAIVGVVILSVLVLALGAVWMLVQFAIFQAIGLGEGDEWP